ncbi:hypothetical protein RKD37_003025 [Streptomyces ambofaciens]
MKCAKSVNVKKSASASGSVGTLESGWRAASSETMRGGGGTDVVDVQFGLRQPGDEGVQVARDVGVDEVLGQGFLPRAAPSGPRGGGGARVIG